jgi:hypothetical protein
MFNAKDVRPGAGTGLEYHQVASAGDQKVSFQTTGIHHGLAAPLRQMAERASRYSSRRERKGRTTPSSGESASKSACGVGESASNLELTNVNLESARRSGPPGRRCF